jgi:hypothetical protein
LIPRADASGYFSFWAAWCESARYFCRPSAPVVPFNSRDVQAGGFASGGVGGMQECPGLSAEGLAEIIVTVKQK